MPTPLDANMAEQNEQTPDTENTAEDTQEQGKVSVSSTDVEIAVRLGIKLLSHGNGLKVISDAIQQSKDPAQVIGQFLAQMMGQMAEELRAKVNIDPKVFLASRGFLEQILDYIETKLGLPKDFSDKVYREVLEAVKAAAMGPQAQQQQPAQPQQQAPAPQQAMPPQGAPGGM